MGGGQNYCPLLGPLSTRSGIIIKDPKRDHGFDNPPIWHIVWSISYYIRIYIV